MKKFVSWILVALVLVTLAAPLTAHAAVMRAALCDENDGGEMVWQTWETNVSWGDPRFEIGTYNGRTAEYVITTRIYTYNEGYRCTVNKAHAYIVFSERRTETKREFLGYLD